MFSINIKGKANPKDPKMVKLKLVIFKTGYACVTKVLQISAPIKDWDNQFQSFQGNSSALISKTKFCSTSRVSIKRLQRIGNI